MEKEILYVVKTQSLIRASKAIKLQSTVCSVGQKDVVKSIHFADFWAPKDE
jgi:hypothetical protein